MAINDSFSFYVSSASQSNCSQPYPQYSCCVSEDAAVVEDRNGKITTAFLNRGDQFGIIERGRKGGLSFEIPGDLTGGHETARRCGGNAELESVARQVGERMKSRWTSVTRLASFTQAVPYRSAPPIVRRALSESGIARGRLTDSSRVVHYTASSASQSYQVIAGAIDFDQNGSWDALFIVGNEFLGDEGLMLPASLRGIHYFTENSRTVSEGARLLPKTSR